MKFTYTHTDTYRYYIINIMYTYYGASQVSLVVKNPPANAGDVRDICSISELGRSPGRGPGNPLQYSYLKNPMDRGAWRAMVHRVAKSCTQLKNLACTHTYYITYTYVHINII